MDPVFPKPSHNHSQCVDEAIAAATRICQENNVRFTYLRKRVLELIWTSHKPVGAYDILAMMNEGSDSRFAPMTVYRAIEFLMENGLVHRIESRNAYVGCRHPGSTHEGQFLLCRHCGRFAEIEELEISKALSSGAKRAGFDAVNPLIEIEGRCRDCREPSRE